MDEKYVILTNLQALYSEWKGKFADFANFVNYIIRGLP